MEAQIVILDYGSQYTQLIARKVRELGVSASILPPDTKVEQLSSLAKGIILSGGPSSVSELEGPRSLIEGILERELPVLGICYGMQLLSLVHGAEITSGDTASGKEYGPQKVLFDKGQELVTSTGEASVWMSHGDSVSSPPEGFEVFARSEQGVIAGIYHAEKKIYGLQFHPEVQHTTVGLELLGNFVLGCCAAEKDWNPGCFIERAVESISKQAPEGNLICGLSGGVDSTVAAVLVARAVGSRLKCIFVDNGLLRKNEAEEVMSSMTALDLDVVKVDASEEFLSALEGVSDPEKKRKIIGHTFIDVFERAAAESVSGADYLVQGTLYPDVIESVSVIGKSVTIKSHHNVGGLKDEMKLELVEPLRELFKDEVREVGVAMGIAEELVYRQPFPGPGLAVRCLGEITREKLEILRTSDAILREEVRNAGLDREIWQYFTVVLPIQSVGVMGDSRTYDRTVAVRAITSTDGMTADWYYFPKEVLTKISARIVNETPGVNRVVYDISTKPPATIEWE